PGAPVWPRGRRSRPGWRKRGAAQRRTYRAVTGVRRHADRSKRGHYHTSAHRRRLWNAGKTLTEAICYVDRQLAATMLDFTGRGANLPTMRTTILSALFISALAGPAQAQGYPVQGKWGQSSNTEKGTIDCTDNKRIIVFTGDQRTDSTGGVPGYRNQ